MKQRAHLYRDRLNGWVAREPVALAGFGIALTLTLDLIRGWSLAELLVGLLLILGLLLVPPIWVGVTPEQAALRDADRIILRAQIRSRRRAWATAALSGIAIGFASALGRTGWAPVGIAALGVLAAGLSYSSGRRYPK